MKKIILVLSVIIIGISCSVPRNTPLIKENGETATENDSLEYRLETFDPKFETWYLMQNNPSQYRAQQYYEAWNQRYVNAWNYHSTQSARRNFFEPIIGYDSSVDYGFEINHKLFYYFQYVERVLRIPIISGGPRSLVF
jgi:hypothetical protein